MLNVNVQRSIVHWRYAPMNREPGHKKSRKEVCAVKKLLTVLLALTVLLTACQNGENRWKTSYKEIVEQWNTEHSKDSIYGYRLVFLDEDDIPELVLAGADDWGKCELYTYRNDKAERFMTVDNIGVDGKGIYCFEKSGIIAESSFMSGNGGYTMKRPLSGKPDEVVCEYQIKTDINAPDNIDTYIKYAGADGNAYEKTYEGTEYEFAELPEKADIESALGIKDISDMLNVSEENGLLSYDEVMKKLE